MWRRLLSRLGAGDDVAIPDTLWDDTLAALPFTHRLDADARARLRTLCARLLADKEMSGAGGLQLTADMQLAIAVQACLPVLELGLHWYRGWTSIVVYPAEFLVPRQVEDEDGVVHEYVEPIAGEAWDGGPLLLSWDDVVRAADLGPAYNVVIHEFTHKIDQLDGQADGMPPLDRALHGQIDPRRWRAVFEEAYARFCDELDLIEAELPADIAPDDAAADRWYEHLPLDPYAAHDEGEFFAVSTEAFFVAPARLRDAFPDWYAQLEAFFRQRPLAP